MEEPIRILNVVGRMDRGGIETLIMNVYRNIDRNKIQFDFLAHYGKDDADYNQEIKEMGGRIYEMPVIKTTEKTYFWKYFEYKNALKKFFKTHPEYHIIHGHMTNTAAIYMPIAKKYGKVSTCIAHSHLTETQKTISPLVAFGTNLLKYPIKKYATDYFACSKAAAYWIFRKSDVNIGKVKIIKNGIDSSLFDYSIQKRNKVRKKLSLENKVVIGHVGRFFPQKNHAFILKIFDEYVKKINENSILLLVGDGELKEEIEKIAKELNIYDKIMFMGVRSDVNDIMQAMDIFLMPSFYEGLPMVGIESQAAGLPLLVSDKISSELDITGNVTFFSLNNQAYDWAKKIDEILGNFKRNSTRYKIIESGYDIKNTVRFLEEFYIKKHFESKIGEEKRK